MVIRQMNISHDMTRVRDRRDAQGDTLRARKTRSGVTVAVRSRIDAGGDAHCVRTLQRLATALRVSDLIGKRPTHPRNT